MAFTKYFSRKTVLSLLMQIVPFGHSISVVLIKFFRNKGFIVMQVESLLLLLVIS